MSYELLLELATEGAARSLGLESVGRLAPGWKADIITVSLDAPHLRPVFPEQNLLANLVYAGNGADVVDTIVDGAVLMRDRELLTIDEEAVFDRAQTAARELNEAVQSTN
jgi:5-methylthioadenosine/S-adenosylhomocysteine deaminase